MQDTDLKIKEEVDLGGENDIVFQNRYAFQEATWIQKLTYTWLTPWIQRARKGYVYPNQMGLLSESDSC